MSTRSRHPKVHKASVGIEQRTLCGLLLEAKRPQPLKLADKLDEVTCKLCQSYGAATGQLQPFACAGCNIRFDTRAQLLEHIAKEHPGAAEATEQL